MVARDFGLAPRSRPLSASVRCWWCFASVVEKSARHIAPLARRPADEGGGSRLDLRAFTESKPGSASRLWLAWHVERARGPGVVSRNLGLVRRSGACVILRQSVDGCAARFGGGLCIGGSVGCGSVAEADHWWGREDAPSGTGVRAGGSGAEREFGRTLVRDGGVGIGTGVSAPTGVRASLRCGGGGGTAGAGECRSRAPAVQAAEKMRGYLVWGWLSCRPRTVGRGASDAVASVVSAYPRSRAACMTLDHLANRVTPHSALRPHTEGHIYLSIDARRRR
jgi:hypothetical protein